MMVTKKHTPWRVEGRETCRERVSALGIWGSAGQALLDGSESASSHVPSQQNLESASPEKVTSKDHSFKKALRQTTKAFKKWQVEGQKESEIRGKF